MRPARYVAYLGGFLGTGVALWLALTGRPGWALAFLVGEIFLRNHARPDGYVNREVSAKELWLTFSMIAIFLGTALMSTMGWIEISGGGVPKEYRPALAVLLFAIYTALVWRRFRREHRWMAERAGDRYLP